MVAIELFQQSEWLFPNSLASHHVLK